MNIRKEAERSLILSSELLRIQETIIPEAKERNIKRKEKDPSEILAEAIEKMKEIRGEEFSADRCSVAELMRLTGLTRARCRKIKADGLVIREHGNKGRKRSCTVLTGYEDTIDDLLRRGIRNSSVCMEAIAKEGYEGGISTVKAYIKTHLDLLPAERRMKGKSCSRGQRYTTGSGEAYQMDWGFINVECIDGTDWKVCCLAFVCHHCGYRHIEFFASAKQENLFIGMIHAFEDMGIPERIITDNMRSVTDGRDSDGHAVFNKAYDGFQKAVGFRTTLCKPGHPYTKGAVGRLVRFVKDNFAKGRVFMNLTELNAAAMRWCETQNGKYSDSHGCIPAERHFAEGCRSIGDESSLLMYLAPIRRISPDGFISFESRMYGVPYSYAGKEVRVMRCSDELYILDSGTGAARGAPERGDPRGYAADMRPDAGTAVCKIRFQNGG